MDFETTFKISNEFKELNEVDRNKFLLLLSNDFKLNKQKYNCNFNNSVNFISNYPVINNIDLNNLFILTDLFKSYDDFKNIILKIYEQ